MLIINKYINIVANIQDKKKAKSSDSIVFSRSQTSCRARLLNLKCTDLFGLWVSHEAP